MRHEDPRSDPDWLSWPQAAALVGCPEPTIEWYVRQGRIEKRSPKGNRPSLRRASVVEFANWWAARLNTRAQKEQATSERSRQWLEPPEPSGWLSTDQAARLLGVRRGNVDWLLRQGRLRGVKTGRRWWIEDASVEERVRTAQKWVSHIEAARIAGCSPTTILRAANQGLIERRQAPRSHPSLLRSSVETFRDARTT